MKPSRYDHDKALEMAWSGQLTEEEINICDIITGAYAASTDVQNEHYEEFKEIELRFDCSIHT